MALPLLRKNTGGQYVDGFSVFLDGARVITPAIEAGDFVAYLDGVLIGNITVAETPAGSGILRASPTQAMTNGEMLTILAHDQTATAAWEDINICVPIDTQTVGDLLAAAGYTAPPSAAAIDAQLTASHGAGLWGGGAGTGVITFTYSLTYTNPSPPPANLPIDGALVWVTTDVLQVNRVAQGLTDAFGEVVFYLDPGTYYFWRAKDGYEFTNPDIEVVS